MKNWLVVLLMVIGWNKVFAQADIHFSQFYETSILRNPALTGVFADDYKFGLYYRNQWKSITFPYETFLFSAETRFSVSHASEDFVSIGVLGFSDKAGSLSQQITTVYPAVNYNKSINPNHNSYLSVGFTFGYIQYSFDPSKATFNSQYMNGTYDPNNPSMENMPKPNMNLWDMGAGVNYNMSMGVDNKATMVLGASAYHFTQPGFSYYKTPEVDLNLRFNANAALGFAMNEDMSMQLHANYARQGTYSEIMAGGLFNWTAASMDARPIFGLSFGAFYRYNDAVIPVIKLKYMNWSLGMSYDTNISTLKEASNMQGGLEMTLFVSGQWNNGNAALKKTVCPRF